MCTQQEYAAIFRRLNDNIPDRTLLQLGRYYELPIRVNAREVLEELENRGKFNKNCLSGVYSWFCTNGYSENPIVIELGILVRRKEKATCLFPETVPSYARDLFVYPSDYEKLYPLNYAPQGCNWRALGGRLRFTDEELDQIFFEGTNTRGMNPVHLLLRAWLPRATATKAALINALNDIGQQAVIQSLGINTNSVVDSMEDPRPIIGTLLQPVGYSPPSNASRTTVVQYGNNAKIISGGDIRMSNVMKKKSKNDDHDDSSDSDEDDNSTRFANYIVSSMSETTDDHTIVDTSDKPVKSQEQGIRRLKRLSRKNPHRRYALWFYLGDSGSTVKASDDDLKFETFASIEGEKPESAAKEKDTELHIKWKDAATLKPKEDPFEFTVGNAAFSIAATESFPRFLHVMTQMNLNYEPPLKEYIIIKPKQPDYTYSLDSAKLFLDKLKPKITQPCAIYRLLVAPKNTTASNAAANTLKLANNVKIIN